MNSKHKLEEDKLDKYAKYFDEADSTYDFINPNHYKKGYKEVIDMMIDIWGKESVSIHCEITAFKYRMRLGNKPGQPIEQDLKKAQWYENKAIELKKIS